MSYDSLLYSTSAANGRERPSSIAMLIRILHTGTLYRIVM